MVNETPRIITTNDKNSFWSLSNKVKKPKSGKIFELTEIATSPENPKNKTIGIIKKNANNKLRFNIL